ncbi:helix-turn-helix domain-containing protein [Pseudoalteromonas ruthenica]|uniref:helix-turn-helix domain-containing protein n=1 Tax=Pseudoalteromonas ruthenica TaxID=151081 RepID=UPI00241FFA67|nr:helix-turn-helix domain-containing protein [Pseudoalteromonas ruthenica]|tara:strand:- start:22682 stop:22954 length:273 start_codon:yes stop_codon:yes gene_type:complete
MKPEEIKLAIRQKGYTLSMLADALEVNLATVSGVVCGHTQSRRTALAIAKLIDKPIEDIFPKVPSYTQPKHLKGAQRKTGVEQLRQLLAS